MPRTARENHHHPGAILHVMSRFVDGRFLIDEVARRQFLRFLAVVLHETDWTLLSYAVMTTHIHLALLMGWVPFESWAHPLNTRFAIWMTSYLKLKNPEARGHIFADRPKTKPLPVERALPVVTYHHRNPDEAGVVEAPEQSTWTSHRAMLGLAPERGGLDTRLSLELCGYDTTVEGRRAFAEHVARTRVTAEEIGLVEPKERLPRRWSSPQWIFSRACEAVGILVEDARGGWNRKHAPVLARRVALIVAARTGAPSKAMADELFISPSNASRQLVKGLEDKVATTLAEQILAEREAA